MSAVALRHNGFYKDLLIHIHGVKTEIRQISFSNKMILLKLSLNLINTFHTEPFLVSSFFCK